MDLRKLRDKATEAFTKGKFAKAAEYFQEYCQADPKDHQSRLRMGDAWAKAGSKDRAILAYKSAAEGFAKDGFLPRAIAASKLILELDPSHQGVQGMLADLYARKSGAPSRSPAPSRPAVEPSIELPAEEPDDAPMELELNASPPAPVADKRGPLDLSEELPPELRLEAPEEPPKPAEPSVAVEIEVEHSGAGSSPAEFELVLDSPPEAQSPPPPASAVALQAPPGLKQRKAPEAPMQAPLPQAPPGSRFDELEFDENSFMASPAVAGASLLHAVEAAARVGLEARGQVEEQPDEEIIEAPEEVGPSVPSQLPEIPLFSDLPKDAFIELFERCPLRRLERGDRVIEQGSAGNSFFVICDGDARVYREEGATRRDLALLHDGAFFGEMALLSDAPRSASVEIESAQAQVLEISAATLAALSGRYPQVAQALRKFCRQRMLANVMNTSALFKPFNREDRRTLVTRFRTRDVGPGEVIVAEGTPSDGMYVVLFGEVEVTTAGQSLALLKEGEIFGEISLLMRTAATASVTVTKRSSLLRLPREDFGQLILSHPQILELVAELADDRRQKTEAVLSGAARMGEEGLMLV